jgi:hypothetical protein
MAFQGGVLQTIGITPQFISQLGTVAASSVGTQLFQGAGQTFYGQAGQTLVNNVASNVINIGLNSALGTSVASASGFDLSNGANLLASTITPALTGALAGGINQSINSALKNAGPFGSVLGQVGSSLVNQAANTLTNNIFGGALGGGVGGGSPPSKLYPGGGGEPASDYENVAYTTNDIVFSIQPANQGPQTFGLSSAFNTPFSATSIPIDQFWKTPPNVNNPVVDKIKKDAMNGGVFATSFTPSAPLAPSIVDFSKL